MTEATSTIKDLTPEHAQAAILKFYELLPKEVWQGSKPTLRSVQFRVNKIKAEATSDLKSFLEMMLEEPDDLLLGETAIVLLAKLNEYEKFKDYVTQAIEITTGKLGAGSKTIGALLAFVILIEPQIDITKDGIKINPDISDTTELVRTAVVGEIVKKCFKEKQEDKS